MSQENVEAVRRMFERWNAGDVEGWLHCWDTDAEWISEQPFEALEGRARTYRGHAELRRFAADVLEGFTDLGQVEHAHFRDVGDSVVVLAEYRAKGGASGAGVASPSGWLFEVRDGRITRGRGFVDQRQALEAAGLRE
jgi:ketosteroid isomerase-like protein